MNGYFIKTFGCKTNQIESEIISSQLQKAGYIESNLENADILVINSCAVTSIAEDDAIKFAKHFKAENKNSLVVLTGCVAQLRKEDLLKGDIIDIVIGIQEKCDIAEIIKQNKRIVVSNVLQKQEFKNYQIPLTGKSRASVKIQDGCNNRCSYCTISIARGISRSNSIENIINQINLFIENNYQEIILTGINIGLWGKDLNPQYSLLTLLKEIEKTEIPRYRLGSLGVHDIDKEMIDFLRNSQKFCPHFHLSLQSLCDKTLINMNRHNTAKEALILIDKINNKFNKPFIGSDIIVGFPQESEEDFKTTLNNAKMSGLSQIHVFPYSIRTGTKAAEMSGQVEQNTKKERAKQLKEVSEIHLNSFLENNINTQRKVIILKGKNNKGITENYINTTIENLPDKYENKIYTVKLLKKESNNIISRIL